MLWAYITIQWIPIGETPFKLAFGTKVVIPLKINLPSYRVEKLDKENNSSNLRANLDFLNEVREEHDYASIINDVTNF